MPPASPTFIRGNLSSSQERQPSVRSPQPALLKSRPARVSSQGWQKNWKLFAQTRGLSFGNAQLFSPNRAISSWNAPLFPALLNFFAEWHEFFAASYYFFYWIARFLLRFLVSLSAHPPTRQPPPPSFIHNVLSAYVYLPSIRCPRRPLRHESRYRRRSPRRMGTINRDRRTTPDHRQRIARCAR